MQEITGTKPEVEKASQPQPQPQPRAPLASRMALSMQPKGSFRILNNGQLQKSFKESELMNKRLSFLSEVASLPEAEQEQEPNSSSSKLDGPQENDDDLMHAKLRGFDTFESTAQPHSPSGGINAKGNHGDDALEEGAAAVPREGRETERMHQSRLSEARRSRSREHRARVRESRRGDKGGGRGDKGGGGDLLPIEIELAGEASMQWRERWGASVEEEGIERKRNEGTEVRCRKQAGRRCIMRWWIDTPKESACVSLMCCVRYACTLLSCLSLCGRVRDRVCVWVCVCVCYYRDQAADAGAVESAPQVATIGGLSLQQSADNMYVDACICPYVCSENI